MTYALGLLADAGPVLISARWSRLLREGAAAIRPWFVSSGRQVPAAGIVARLRP